MVHRSYLPHSKEEYPAKTYRYEHNQKVLMSRQVVLSQTHTCTLNLADVTMSLPVFLFLSCSHTPVHSYLRPASITDFKSHYIKALMCDHRPYLYFLIQDKSMAFTSVSERMTQQMSFQKSFTKQLYSAGFTYIF